MNVYDIKDYTKGWFVGPFNPTIIKTDAFECAVKKYSKGDTEGLHVHKVATELTVIVDGSVEMNGVVYNSGSILEITPGEATDFKALSDVTTFVVKVPGVIGDKYVCE